MAESIITGTIYKTRQDSGTRIVVCAKHHVKWERKKKKKKNTKCTMLLYFFGFLRLFSFHYVFLMCCFMSTGDRSYLILACPR